MIDGAEGPEPFAGAVDALGAAVDDLHRQIPPIEGGTLVHRVRAGMQVRARRRRRNVRIAVGSGAAAVLVAVVTVFAVGSTRTKVHVSSNVLRPEAAPAHLTVEPSTGLHERQSVTVTAYGLDPGTDVTFLLCIDGDAAPQVIFAGHLPDPPRWACLGSIEGNDSGPVRTTSHSVADSPGSLRPSDPTRAIAALPISDWIFDFSIWVDSAGSTSPDHLYPGEDPPTPGCGPITRWTQFEDKRLPTITPCRVVAIGSQNGRQTTLSSEPLQFVSAAE